MSGLALFSVASLIGGVPLVFLPMKLVHADLSLGSLHTCASVAQRERLLAAYREAGGPAVDGFRHVMRGVMGPPARAMLDAKAEALPPAPTRTRVV